MDGRVLKSQAGYAFHNKVYSRGSLALKTRSLSYNLEAVYILLLRRSEALLVQVLFYESLSQNHSGPLKLRMKIEQLRAKQ